MKQYNYPTTIYFGEGSIVALGKYLKEKRLKNDILNKILLVTDKTLTKLGIVKEVVDLLSIKDMDFVIFNEVHPNPLEEDIEKGAKVFRDNQCDSIVAIGGGSPMDAAKVIRIALTHDGPLFQYDDALGGDKLIVNKMPPMYAVPTTAGTGSEVGRAAVIMMKRTGKKTIFFAPKLIPDIAILDPLVTEKLPKHITAATGIDALTHCIEAYLAPGFDPMADGIALEGISLVLSELPKVYKDGSNLKARGKMLMAATMGATAFQKGLGMVHSLAHPLSSQFNMHHGLANALLLPFSLKFLEKKFYSTITNPILNTNLQTDVNSNSTGKFNNEANRDSHVDLNADLNDDSNTKLNRLQNIRELFKSNGFGSNEFKVNWLQPSGSKTNGLEVRSIREEKLSDYCRSFIESLGVKFGLRQHGIDETAIDKLAEEAFADPCHQTNIIPVNKNELVSVYRASL